jgi:hypothetical protein
VYDLMGDNMYNSNWGYQNGKVRNARVRKTFEPVTILKYTATPSDDLEASATLLWRTGKNGYTALDWYDAADPRPDYYRNLPSYFYMDDPDYDRENLEKYAWAKEAWEQNYPQYSHLNWDRLYDVNYNNVDEDGMRRLWRTMQPSMGALIADCVVLSEPHRLAEELLCPFNHPLVAPDSGSSCALRAPPVTA